MSVISIGVLPNWYQIFKVTDSCGTNNPSNFFGYNSGLREFKAFEKTN